MGDWEEKDWAHRIQFLFGVKIVQIIIAGGGRHSAAPTDDGELYEWRRGKHGRLGLGDDKSSKMVSQKVPTPGGNKHCPGILLRHSFSGIDYRWTNFLGTCKI
ncbi:ultraviolet-B receptor UVR8-like isoform X1 [Zingiber officinale]|uniref:ultraviolet-B receptor UVR8-like isoform X1 n=1 Tax=Zingiber officinale TaxID=94328 RepID=UPI001C4DA4DB|nr:ultraviolet-B receptor UVR8-like isoform X1 [Zingiber officinale]